MTWLRGLKNWLSHSRSRPLSGPGSPLSVVIYTRADCHLCEVAKELLESRRDRLGFTITVRDIDSDPALQARYGECVPVVEIAGKERFRGRVNAVLLERTLRAETTRRRPLA